MSEASATERRLLEAMEKIGLRPQPQYRISEMTVDFAFPEWRVVIEVDGPHHRTRERQEEDGARDDFLQSHGWRVRRFSAEQVYENPAHTARQVKQFLGRVEEQDKNGPDAAIEATESSLLKAHRRLDLPQRILLGCGGAGLVVALGLYLFWRGAHLKLILGILIVALVLLAFGIVIKAWRGVLGFLEE